MARELGVFKRPDSRFYWMNVTLLNGERIRQSTGTESREEAEAYLAKHTLDAYRAAHFGIKPPRLWSDAVVRYLTFKQHLRSFKDTQRISRSLVRYLSKLTLQQIDGDVVWTVIQGESKKGNKPATINRYLALMRSLLRMASDEWQWIDTFPKVCCLVK